MTGFVVSKSSIQKTCPAFIVKLYVSGDYSIIKSVCQIYCLQGLCLSVKRIDYIFTMGNCEGAEITLINYPRFPKDSDEIKELAKNLGEEVTKACGQGSFTLETQDEMYFWSRRKEDISSAC